MKIIQEKHYNKAEQKLLDQYVANTPETYKNTYINMQRGYLNCLMYAIELSRLIEAVREASYSTNDFAVAMGELGSILKKIQ